MYLIVLAVALVGFVGCGVINNGVEDDLKYNWKLGQVMMLGLPEDSFKEEFFEESVRFVF